MSTSNSVNYGDLMKRVEQVVAAIDRADDIGATIQAVANGVVTKFSKQLGMVGGRIYRRDGEFFELESTFGEAKKLPTGLRLPIEYPPIQAVLGEGAVFMARDDHRVDPGIESRLGVEEFAAIQVGDHDKYFVLAFDVAHGQDQTEILFSLSILRHSINHKIRQERLDTVLREARLIQASIMPRQLPSFGAFDVFGRTESMEFVGGDFYDFIPVSEKILGLAIADVSGHGLPAALLVRDIHMGLRMGLSRDYKIVRTVERLNSIIHESTLTSRFVSMVYGELEKNGNFIYVNSGHPPPFHLDVQGVAHSLSNGGAVLGPIPDATYERGFVSLRPGELIVMYTDGIVEAQGPGVEAAGGSTSASAEEVNEEEYGEDRLLAVVRAHRHKSSADIVAAIFDSVESFCGVTSPADDRTVMVVRSPG